VIYFPSRIYEIDKLGQLLDNIRESYHSASFACKIVMTSGYFLYLHNGHIDYLREATRYGNIWITIVNGNEATKKKYGKLYVDAEVRAKVISSLKFVHYTTIFDAPEMSEAIKILKPAIVYNSGDRDNNNSNKEENRACREVGAKMIFGGAAKVNSSSQILKNIQND